MIGSIAPWTVVTGTGLEMMQPLMYSMTPLPGTALVERLQPYDIICMMRERTPIDAALMDQLPNLKGIVTSGMRNAALDIDAAKSRGLMVSGTGSPGHATSNLPSP
jgi:lactate dehydrogenase-like 2-hydroxyacid dehydrogenase